MGLLDTVRRLLQGEREKASPGDPARSQGATPQSNSTPPHGDPLREEAKPRSGPPAEAPLPPEPPPAAEPPPSTD